MVGLPAAPSLQVAHSSGVSSCVGFSSPNASPPTSGGITVGGTDTLLLELDELELDEELEDDTDVDELELDEELELLLDEDELLLEDEELELLDEDELLELELDELDELELLLLEEASSPRTVQAQTLG